MPEASFAGPLLVKRYANRKIYVPEDKSYTNLQGLYGVILSGRDVRVTCVSTQTDVTAQVLGMVYQACVVVPGGVSATTLFKRLRADRPLAAMPLG